jgi:hypothetical protein
MQHIAFDKLRCRMAENLCARHVGPREDERSRVLQLIAKTQRSARLIIGAPPPHATTQVLIRKPAVHHQIDFPIGRFDLDGRERIAPKSRHRFERVIDAARVAIRFN